MKISKARREIVLILAASFLFLSTWDACAFIAGTEVAKKSSSPNCFLYKKYIIVVKSSGGIGDIIAVRERTSTSDSNCIIPSEKSGIFTIDGSDSTETFVGLYRHFLFTDSGTGPDGRGISIYNLKKKKLVYSATYSGGGMEIQNGALILYKAIESKKKIDCTVPQWPGPFGYEQETRVDLESLREEVIGKITCSPRQ